MQQQIDDMEVPLLNDSNSNRQKSLAQERAEGFGGSPSTLTVCRGRGEGVCEVACCWALNASSCYFRNMHGAKNSLSFGIWSSVTCCGFCRGYRHAFHEHALEG